MKTLVLSDQFSMHCKRITSAYICVRKFISHFIALGHEVRICMGELKLHALYPCCSSEIDKKCKHYYFRKPAFNEGK